MDRAGVEGGRSIGCVSFVLGWAGLVLVVEM